MTDIITPSSTGLSRQALKRQADKQQILRLFHGAYLDADEYAALDNSGRYRARARAFLATHPKLRAWGITAAALEGSPVLSGSPLHFSGAYGDARSRQKDCVFHGALPPVPSVNNYLAQILFECASASPLPDTLVAVNYLLRRHATRSNSSLGASREIDEKTTEAFFREPLNLKNTRLQAQSTVDISRLNTKDPDFLKAYSTMRPTRFTSPEAELLWLDFAQLCDAYGARRAICKTLRAGLYFSDQIESPAESLLLARCVELGFAVPFLQVNILDPVSRKYLGRVDGLWASSSVLKGLYQQDSEYGRFIYCKQRGDNDSIVIEFDDQLKYQQDYVEVLVKERQRQNAIGNLGFRFVRIGWDDLMQPNRLRAILSAAKIPRAKHS